ncbi:MAG: FAD-dependent oxidoreductase [Anaerolineae bacterium]
MQDQAQVVVIGGGIMGCSIAYHLARLGWADVMLLEKGALASGSTARAAGLVTQFHTSPNMMQIRKYSIELYSQLVAEVGETAGWRQVGSLRLGSSKDRLKALQRQVSRAKALGLDVEIISPAEALRLFPYMTDASLHGAVYLRQDGHLDPHSITMELARRARQLGVTVHTGVRVTGIDLSPSGEIAQVNTDHGSIKTECVVNAAGMWAPRIGAMVGINLPMAPVRHQYLTTRPIPGYELPRETPVLRDPDNLVYIREEVRGFLIGGFELDPKVWSIDGVSWGFSEQPLPSDWDLFQELIEGAIRRIPILEQAEAINLLNFPDAVTPDGQPCLGPVPGLRGFYVAAGMSLNGFGGGGGLGKLMAEWIVEGAPSIDVHEMNVQRFGPIHADPAYVAERAREVYKYYYYLRYPNDENEWGRPQRVSAVYPRTQELGAVFGEKNGWERVNYYEPGQPWRRAGADQRRWGWGRPAYFDRVDEEHRAAREQVALFDLSSFGKIELRGPGALALLQRLADNDIDRSVGSVIYTQFLNARGGIESDLTITRLADDHFRVISGSAFVYRDLGWIQMHMPRDGSVKVRDVSEAWACLGLWGPHARDVLQAGSPSDVSNEAFPYMTAQAIDVAGAQVWAQRVSYVGELGWELYIQTDDAIPVWDALMAAGQPFGIQPAGYKAIDSLRLEKGYRYWSVDLTPSENPYEAGLGFCVRLGKGDFVGREALLEAKAPGLQRRLCTLVLYGDPWLIYGGEAVYSNGRIVSRVRSAGYGYTVGKTIAYAYLPPELTEVGTPLEVEIFGERIPAEVAADVLYDPQGARLRV